MVGVQASTVVTPALVTTLNDEAGAPTGEVVPTELGTRKSTLVALSKLVPAISTGVPVGHVKVGAGNPVIVGGAGWNCQSEIVRDAPHVFGVELAEAWGAQAPIPSVIVTIAWRSGCSAQIPAGTVAAHVEMVTTRVLVEVPMYHRVIHHESTACWPVGSFASVIDTVEFQHDAGGAPSRLELRKLKRTNWIATNVPLSASDWVVWASRKVVTLERSLPVQRTTATTTKLTAKRKIRARSRVAPPSERRVADLRVNFTSQRLSGGWVDTISLQCR